MNKTSNQTQLHLPSIESIEFSEAGFSHAFLIAAKILVHHCEQIRAAIGANENFTSEPFNSDMLALFCKTSRHYFSYVLLEINRSKTGSQFLIEHLSETAITLAFLLESGESDSSYADYISASVHQGRYLLVAVKEQLQELPNHPDLLSLKVQLETIITNQQTHIAKRACSIIPSEAHLWGPESANTTAKRGAIVGLNFLTNPARQIALKVMPGSWLELQLDYLDSLANSSRNAQPGINFQRLRDASHLCLHVAQIFLEEIVNHQGFILLDLERHEHSFNVLFEWFYEAQHLSQLCQHSL